MPEPAIKADDDDEPNPMSVRIMKSVDELPPELRALVYKYDYHRVWFLLPKKKLPSGPGWKVTGAQEDWQHAELCSPYEYDPNAVKPTVKQIEAHLIRMQERGMNCEWEYEQRQKEEERTREELRPWREKFERWRSMTPEQLRAEAEKCRLKDIEEEKLRRWRQEWTARNALEAEKEAKEMDKFFAELEVKTKTPKVGKFPRRA
jgi:hypothetical protein